MSDDLASAVARMGRFCREIEPHEEAAWGDNFVADLRLILSALKDAGEALCASPSRYDRGDCCGFPDNCPLLAKQAPDET